ncbi:HD domain-containing protein [Oceanobacillus halotolerans]|uniref:HD domain-containing protein n=1 Tax=Oceanobacillus halotolerans TaxID=2663380 RepID=UPI0013DA7644|nr:HD domain-containing protein [Oceanobacillus halotolerans]
MSQSTSYFYDFIPISFNVSQNERDHILATYPPPSTPDGETFFNIEQETEGNMVDIRVVLNDFQVQVTKTNKNYLKMTFSNNNGVIQAKMWDNDGAVDAHLPILEAYSVFDLKGKVDKFLGHKSLTITKLIPCEESINPFSLLPYTNQDMEGLTVELFAYIYELHSPYQEIALAAMNRFWKQFRIRPAAKGFHHNYLGGLLKHTVGLMRFARYITIQEKDPFQATMKLINVVEKAYKKELWFHYESTENTKPQFVWKDTIDHLYRMLQGMMEYKEEIPNTDIIITSILFHDIGKLLEYDHAGKTFEDLTFLFPTADSSEINDRKQAGITMDPLGVRIGHIPYGVLMLTKLIEAEDISISLTEIHQMAHCILCHHGLPEWGSAIKKPQTIEGYIIHIVDFLDSRYENTETVK